MRYAPIHDRIPVILRERLLNQLENSNKLDALVSTESNITFSNYTAKKNFYALDDQLMSQVGLLGMYFDRYFRY